MAGACMPATCRTENRPRSMIVGGRWSTAPPLPATPRPDLRTLRDAVVAIDALLIAVPAERAARQPVLEGALGRVDWGALDRGDTAGFDRSLAAAIATLKPLDPWLKSFTVWATG